jgi:hypothetical protein
MQFSDCHAFKATITPITAVILTDESLVFMAASILEALEDEGDFAEAMTDKLNMILLTVPEAATLRRKLMLEDLIRDAGAAKAEGKDRDSRVVFETLFRSWCLCPVAALTLCLVRGSLAVLSVYAGYCSLKCVSALLFLLKLYMSNSLHRNTKLLPGSPR